MISLRSSELGSKCPLLILYFSTYMVHVKADPVVNTIAPSKDTYLIICTHGLNFICYPGITCQINLFC